MSIFSGVVKDVSSEGLGVVIHPSGLTYFVPGAWPGDAGQFLITQQEKRYGFARWHQQTTFSEDRQPVACEHLGFREGSCGGCPWMFVKYDRQLQYKHKILSVSFNRYKLDTEILPVHPSERELGYRNRAQLKLDGKHIGYVSPKTRSLAPIKDCVILTDPVRSLLRGLYEQLPNKDWEPTGRHQWNFMDLDDECSLKDVQLNQRRPFKQANAAANVFMRDWVSRQLSEMETDQSVLELFCGSGNFTQVLGAHFHRVIACEVKGNATQALIHKNLNNVEVIEADIFAKIYWETILQKAKSSRVLFLDPPRDGFPDLHMFVDKLVDLEKIIYISCNPKTFLFDIRPLTAKGWVLSPVQPIDQFPHTAHVEIMCVLERKV